MSLLNPLPLVAALSIRGNETVEETCDFMAAAESSLSVVEITGLELLGLSEHSDDSEFSFDSYAHDSFVHAFRHTMVCQTKETNNTTCSTRGPIQPVRRPSNYSSQGEESEEQSLGYESTDVESYAADSVQGGGYLPPTHRRASLGSRTSKQSSGGPQASRRGSLDSYAMDSVQLQRDLPRRYTDFSEFANDSFVVARLRTERNPASSVYQDFNNELSTIKRRISLDSTYNFSQGVYETQSIHGGAGRAA